MPIRRSGDTSKPRAKRATASWRVAIATSVTLLSILKWLIFPIHSPGADATIGTRAAIEPGSSVACDATPTNKSCSCCVAAGPPSAPNGEPPGNDVSCGMNRTPLPISRDRAAFAIVAVVHTISRKLSKQARTDESGSPALRGCGFQIRTKQSPRPSSKSWIEPSANDTEMPAELRLISSRANGTHRSPESVTKIANHTSPGTDKTSTRRRKSCDFPNGPPAIAATI